METSIDLKIGLSAEDKLKMKEDILNIVKPSLKPAGTDTSTNILNFEEDKGVYVATDNGGWYYWNGSAYVYGGVFQATEVADKSVTEEKLSIEVQKKLNNGTIIVPKGKSYSEGEAIALLNFDGWNQHTFNIIAPYLKEKNIPFTLFFTGYNRATGINVNDLKNYMQEMGENFEFGLYTGQPPYAFQGTNNFAEQFSQLKECYDGIVDYGLPKPNVCAYAGGLSTKLTEYICQNAFGLKIGRSTENSKIVNEVTTNFTIPCSTYGDDGYYTITVVDSIVNNKQHRALMTHNILSDSVTDTSYNMRESYLKAWIDKLFTAVNNGTLKCMTFSQYYLYTILPHTANIGQHALVWENDNRQHEYIYLENGWIELTNYQSYK